MMMSVKVLMTPRHLEVDKNSWIRATKNTFSVQKVIGESQLLDERRNKL